MPDYVSAESTYATKPNIQRPGSQADADLSEPLAATRLTDLPDNLVYGAFVTIGNGETTKYNIPNGGN